MTANPTFAEVFTQRPTAERSSRDVRLLPAVEAAGTVGFGRLLAAEFRKLTNTRAGRVLLALIGLSILGIAAALVIWYDLVATPGAWWIDVTVVSLGATILLPILGILLITQEWSQRSALTTFVLEPRRGRVILAKVLVALGWVVIGMAATVVATMLAHAIGAALHDAPMVWAPEWKMLLGTLVVVMLHTLLAMGLGLVLMNSPAAIVMYMALPTLLPIIAMMNDKLATVMTYVDPAKAWAPLHAGMWDGDIAAKALVAVAIWVVLPVTAGVVRHLRREVN